jgi:hypothetical protein
MLAIFREFQTYSIDFPSDYEEEIATRILSSESVDMANLIKDHRWLAIEYSAYCAQLMDDLKTKRCINAEAEVELTKRIEAALMIAELLERIYSHYLHETGELASLHNAQSEYRKMLRERGIEVSSIEKISPSSVSRIIHDQISSANRIRLFAVRLRRAFITSAALLTHFEQYCYWINWMDECTAPVVAYLAWLVLLPRLLKNMFILGKHLIPASLWMSEEEMTLDTSVRFAAQLERHWFELANDIMTVGVGLLNCFVLTGAASVYLGFSLLAFDVALASWRAHYELTRLREIEKTYLDMGNKTSSDLHYLSYLQKRICYEELRHQVAVANTVLLLLSASLSLSIIAFHVVLPLIGAVLAVLTTIANIIATEKIEHYKVDYYKLDDKVTYVSRPSALVANSMFPQAPEVASNTDHGTFTDDKNSRGLYDSVSELLPAMDSTERALYDFGCL